jgi:hypothetical protein
MFLTIQVDLVALSFQDCHCRPLQGSARMFTNPETSDPVTAIGQIELRSKEVAEKQRFLAVQEEVHMIRFVSKFIKGLSEPVVPNIYVATIVCS